MFEKLINVFTWWKSCIFSIIIIIIIIIPLIKYLGMSNPRLNVGLTGMAQRLSVSCDGQSLSLARNIGCILARTKTEPKMHFHNSFFFYTISTIVD